MLRVDSNLPADIEQLASIIIDAGLKVHRALGPGLLESTYEKCLIHELRKRGLNVRSQVPVPIVYDGMDIEEALRLDILVEDKVIIEVKAIEDLKKIHKVQLLTYLRLSNKRLGLLMNFNVELFKDGLHRIVN